MLPVLLHRPTIPVRSFVKWIREINPAIRTNPEIVRPIEEFPLVILHQDRLLAIGSDRPQLIVQVRTSQQISVSIEIQSIRPPARLQERRKFPIHAPS